MWDITQGHPARAGGVLHPWEVVEDSEEKAGRGGKEVTRIEGHSVTISAVLNTCVLCLYDIFQPLQSTC